MQLSLNPISGLLAAFCMVMDFWISAAGLLRLDAVHSNKESLPFMSHSAPGSAVPRLSLMMFLQYAVWGLWLPILGRYLSAPIADGGLGFTGKQIGWIIGLAGSVGAIAAPFVAGQFSDRYFRAERFMAFLLFAGGIVQIILAQQTTYVNWLIFASIYSVLYMPTLTLTNSIAFANLSNTETQFPKVRVWGTIGWIAAAWLFPLFFMYADTHFQILPPFYGGNEHTDVTHRLIKAMSVSGVVSMIYAVYCLTLPATPPKKDAVESIAFKKAFALMAKPSVMVLVVAGVIIALIHQIYFIQTSSFLTAKGLEESRILPAMSIGQFAEIAVLAVLPVLLRRIGFKGVIILGALAYFIRYSIWAIDAMPLSVVVASQVFHGFCYGCFFAGTFMYIDKVAPKDVRNSAQTVIGIVLLGFGPILSAVVMPRIIDATAKTPGELNFSGFWAVNAALGLAVAILVAVAFREEKKAVVTEPVLVDPEVAQ